MYLNGIHHVTAVSAKIAQNLDFYTRVLGLRLVKKSVNQDDVSAYHLFYADKKGTPGTDMTFFDWPHIGPSQRGTDSIAGTAFRVASDSALAFWYERLRNEDARNVRFEPFLGRRMLAFEDPEGQRLYLINDKGSHFEGEIWRRPDIPEEHALRGFYSVVLSAPDRESLAGILEEALHFQEVERTTWSDGETACFIYATDRERRPGAELWLLQQPDLERARLGAGGVHHVAFRVADESAQREWRTRIAQAGLYVTDVIDRFWFRSIYFRVSNGILFEIATEGPGFAIDEEPESLGESLVLPPFLEPRREEIEANLTPIVGGTS
jgi:glyoxalase family protein